MKATPNSDNWPEIQQPLVRYLLGLAYELSGNPAKAVQVYWELWHDYSDQFYGMIAAEKLQLK